MSAREQFALFTPGSVCRCDRCLMAAMLDREPSEILFRAQCHLNGKPFSQFTLADGQAARELRLLETKLETEALCQ